MVQVLSKMADCFITSSPERVLGFGIIAATLFGAAFLVCGSIEDVLYIPDGDGFLQNFGLLAAIFGDAVLFYLAKKYFECCREISNRAGFGKVRGIRGTYVQLLRDLRLRTRYRLVFYLFTIIGLIVLTGNISVHVFGNIGSQWAGIVFDSLDHPLSFTTNKLFSIYSWIIVLPLCGFFSFSATLNISSIVGILDRDEKVVYDLLHSDNAGGFSQLRAAVAYFNIGISIAYLQIALYTLTFHHANDFQLAAYAVTTLALLFGNFIIFGKIDRMITKKQHSALDEKKRKAYEGDHLNFEIMKYYIDVFSKRSLQRRLAVLTTSTKIIVIAIPPILRGVWIAF